MKEKFEHLLESIKKDLIFLGNLVEHNLRQAVKSVETQDAMLADQIITSDSEIDIKEVKIEDQILTLLALQQPVAIDLRFIVGSLKMNNDLERIGDHAVNIARTVRHFGKNKKLLSNEDLEEMRDISCQMLHDSVSAFINQNADLARAVCNKDKLVDGYYEKIVQDTADQVRKDNNQIEQGFAFVRIARSLERVADLATNICEDVVFMKEAKIIRHGYEV